MMEAGKRFLYSSKNWSVGFFTARIYKNKTVSSKELRAVRQWPRRKNVTCTTQPGLSDSYLVAA